MGLEDYIDEETIEFVNELENPKKFHYEEHSDDTIHFYDGVRELDYDEVVDLLNKYYKNLRRVLPGLLHLDEQVYVLTEQQLLDILTDSPTDLSKVLEEWD